MRSYAAQTVELKAEGDTGLQGHKENHLLKCRLNFC